MTETARSTSKSGLMYPAKSHNGLTLTAVHSSAGSGWIWSCASFPARYLQVAFFYPALLPSMDRSIKHQVTIAKMIDMSMCFGEFILWLCYRHRHTGQTPGLEEHGRLQAAKLQSVRFDEISSHQPAKGTFMIPRLRGSEILHEVSIIAAGLSHILAS